MTAVQLALPLVAPAHRCPSFMAETNATLLAIAGQERRRRGGRRQALAVLRWRTTLTKRGAMGHPTEAQLTEAERLEAVLCR